MVIVMCVVGTVLAQLAIALCVAKCFRARKQRRAVEAGSGSGDPPRAAAGSGRAPAAIDTYAGLAALLIALSPESEATTLNEDGAPPDMRQPKMPGPWPGLRKR